MVDEQMIKNSIDYFGETKMAMMCMEESAEFSKAVSKMWRSENEKSDKDFVKYNLIDAVADMEICISIIKQLYDVNEKQVDCIIQDKHEKTRLLIEDNKVTGGKIESFKVYRKEN